MEYLDPEFVSSYSDIERVGPPDPFGVLSTKLVLTGTEGTMAEKLEKLSKKSQQMSMSPEDRFKLNLTLFFKDKYADLGLRETSLQGLVPIVNDHIPDLKYKNPYAFLIGYSVLKGKSIDPIKFNNISRDVVPNVPQVTSEDIIRYALLISEYL